MFTCYRIDEDRQRSIPYKIKKLSEVWEFVVESKLVYPEVLVLNDMNEVVIHAQAGWIDYPKRWSILDLEYSFVTNKSKVFNPNEFQHAAQGLGFCLDGKAPKTAVEADKLIMSLYVS
ncbi:hypothetical protein [Paenibacillus peoriae]|uniref:hypothetical protein n=1 Tax=Paenibacillus peoriae TaxID=59893 RepID=UPI00215B654B|nr:hypothetical protein [Paenibacillus peoriae]